MSTCGTSGLLSLRGCTVGVLRTCPTDWLTLGDMAGLVSAVVGVGGTDSAFIIGECIVELDVLADSAGDVGARAPAFDVSLSLEKNDLIDDGRPTLGVGVDGIGGAALGLTVPTLAVDIAVPAILGVLGISPILSLPLLDELT